MKKICVINLSNNNVYFESVNEDVLNETYGGNLSLYVEDNYDFGDKGYYASFVEDIIYFDGTKPTEVTLPIKETTKTFALPKNNVNTYERIENGVDEVLKYVGKQITFSFEHSNELSNKNLVAVVESGIDGSPAYHHGVYDQVFPNDIILNAMVEVKKQGYFVWHHNDYRGNDSYWITTTPNRPHNWYSQI